MEFLSEKHSLFTIQKLTVHRQIVYDPICEPGKNLLKPRQEVRLHNYTGPSVQKFPDASQNHSIQFKK